MIYEDPQMEANPTTVTADGDARSCEFPKVKFEVTDSSIGKTLEPASPMFLINPSTANAGEHSGEASENIFMTDCEDNEGSLEDQTAFLGKLGTFYREKAMEFKPPRFYGHQLNCLKLWRFVIRLGGYDRVTGYKLWQQVGDSFSPPKTCTTVSSTFHNFYQKILLQYERHRTQNGELQLPIAPPPGFLGIDNEFSAPAGRIVVKDLNLPVSAPGEISEGLSDWTIIFKGRPVRDSAARCRLGWQEQHLLGNGEVAEPIVKDMSANNTPKRAKNLKNTDKIINCFPSARLDVQVVDVGPPADWVKINVRETNDSFKVYALVPGLLRDEVRVQYDLASRLVITGQPNQLDNLWGVTGFKKVVNLPARIDQLQTNAVVSLHGCLHVHVPFAQQNLS
ncbi:AT-rich interactive domain-containing protein 5-like [Solanum tuberosum]|uniref:AT-rich interactive domain-containing protein 5-like n=1 Tax=Solanum tuberosum TaxID=4113 RepID=UPI0003D2655F|nr:PREDICTED: AT-rich interactive domain-containing protein 5-like [Solanum tuberosum]